MVTDVKNSVLLVETGCAKLRNVHVFVHILDGLKFIEPEGVPEDDGAIHADRDHLLLLFEDEDIDDVLLLGRLSIIGDT